MNRRPRRVARPPNGRRPEMIFVDTVVIMNLPRLTAMRWWAALLVFVDHAHPGVTRAPIWTEFGEVGVAFFFVLSGVVLAWSTPGGTPATTFWWRRFARIYPATVVSGVLAAGLLELDAPGLHGSPSSAVADLLLMQAWWPSPTGPVYSFNPVTWSLSCEAFFYLLLPLLLRTFRGRSSKALGVIAAAGLLCAVGISYFISPGAAITFPLLRLPEFALGVAGGLLLRRGWRTRLPVPVALLLLMASWHVAHVLHAQAFGAWLAPATLLLLLAAASADLAGKSSFLTSRTSVQLGEVSFCFYLTHLLVLSAMFDLLGTTALAAAVAFPVALLAAVTLRRTVEVPARRGLADLGDRQGAVARAGRRG